MMRKPIVVLKFGGSVLVNPSSVPQACNEVLRYQRMGYDTIAVVSALKGETDRLYQTAESLGSEQDPSTLAILLSSGELNASALFAIGLKQDGIAAQVLTPQMMSLRAQGSCVNASPTSIDCTPITALLAKQTCPVIPGFIALNEANEIVLLGRGGTDLSAFFIASKLDASRCLLIKDVEGVFSSDPKRTRGPIELYSELSWEEAEKKAAGLVQPKALRYAREQQLCFEISAIGRDAATRIGKESTSPSPSVTLLTQRPRY